MSLGAIPTILKKTPVSFFVATGRLQLSQLLTRSVLKNSMGTGVLASIGTEGSQKLVALVVFWALHPNIFIIFHMLCIHTSRYMHNLLISYIEYSIRSVSIWSISYMIYDKFSKVVVDFNSIRGPKLFGWMLVFNLF